MATGVRAAFALDPGLLSDVYPPDVIDRLRRHVDLVPEVLSDFDAPRSKEALAGVQILLTGWGSPMVDAGVLNAAPALRAVIHAAGSVKHHVTASVFDRGIVVSSAAGANAVPVAEYTLAAAVLASKRALRRARLLTEGHAVHRLARDGGLYGAVVGVIGASSIGRLVIAGLRDRGARVLLADPHVDEDRARDLGVVLTDVDSLCGRSSLVTIHAPGLPETRGLIDERRLSLMRDGTVVINTARGTILDTEALTRHCAAGRLDAVLDVTDPEPLPAGHALLSLPNVLVTPHLAGAQGRELRLLGEHAADEVERFLSGRPLRGTVSSNDLERIA